MRAESSSESSELLGVVSRVLEVPADEYVELVPGTVP